MKPRAKWYVAKYKPTIGGKQLRAFRSETVPQDGEQDSAIAAVIGPFRTKRAALLMAEYGFNNPHMQTVEDCERIAAENRVEFQTVYVGVANWEYCDIFVRIIGNSKPRVERELAKAVREAAIDAYNSAEPEDKKRVRDYIAEIETYVGECQFEHAIGEDVINAYERSFQGQTETHFSNPAMDYFDYESLRRGDVEPIYSQF